MIHYHIVFSLKMSTINQWSDYKEVHYVRVEAHIYMMLYWVNSVLQNVFANEYESS